MRIPASRFSVLPEGCPVLWGDTPATILASHSTTEYRIRVEGRLPTTTAAGESQLVVDLSTPAAIRAFAPELIAAVRTNPFDLVHPPGVAWDESSPPDAPQYVLVVSIGVAESTALRTVVTGSTPAECLLNGLQAALDAAKDAQ